MRDVPGEPLHRPGLDRRRFLVTWLAGTLIGPLAVEAQQPKQIYRVGFLSGTAADAVPLPKLRAGLRELGYVEGKTIAFEYRFAARPKAPPER
jgi:hypothetical protein